MQLLDGAFFDPAHVGTRDAEERGDLALRQRLVAVKSVPQGYYLALAHVKDRVHKFHGALGVDLSLHVTRETLVAAYHVYVGQGISVSVNVYRVGERHLGADALLRAKIHQYLVRYPHIAARQYRLKFR